ncbi:hypothetical protein GC089_08275 [Cellulomonas sp. JZ18]|uniref:YciI family protein n=1 Tax=Cellulomonas sp. JZ18 TaxID=2654191 RepID=UPI0012D3AD2A|nr:YciI family protein [Cellulomonas sp. JZ18]QGQ19223.1 hypothetical protein GC089_08275 [Cellulomonas sp. JZ18]
MTLFAVRYTYDDRSDVRDAVRPEHRGWLAELADRGVLLGSGPFADEAEPGALLVFRADDEASLRGLLADDPFAREGLVAVTEVRTWNLVLGPWAAGA